MEEVCLAAKLSVVQGGMYKRAQDKSKRKNTDEEKYLHPSQISKSYLEQQFMSMSTKPNLSKPELQKL